MRLQDYSLSSRDFLAKRAGIIPNKITARAKRLGMDNKQNVLSIEGRQESRGSGKPSRGPAIALGAAMRLCRNARGATLLQLAKISGFSASYLAKCERGEVDVPYDTLATICQALDIPVYLVTYLAQPASDADSIMDRNMAHAALVCLKGIRQSKSPSLANVAGRTLPVDAATARKRKGRRQAG
jgi:transcriptional regulator with XRE-family HTH domain